MPALLQPVRTYIAKPAKPRRVPRMFAIEEELPPEDVFIPPSPDRSGRAGRPMPRLEDLPIPGQNELRAVRGETGASDLPEKRRIGLLQRLASVGLGRRDMPGETESLAEAHRPALLEPPRPSSRPGRDLPRATARGGAHPPARRRAMRWTAARPRAGRLRVVQRNLLRLAPRRRRLGPLPDAQLQAAVGPEDQLDALIYLTATVICVPLAKRLGMGSVLGYLIAGTIIGPWGLRLVEDVESILHFSEFGVVLMVGGNIPGLTRTVSIDIYDKVQMFDYAAANRAALVLLFISFVSLSLVYASKRTLSRISF